MSRELEEIYQEYLRIYESNPKDALELIKARFVRKKTDHP
jgi:hypothetical protein